MQAAAQIHDARAGEPTGRGRDAAVDRLRGLVIVLMALDHARDFFGDPRRNPTDLATTTRLLFATRWVTHFCAPTFVLLAGTGAYLQLAKNGATEDARRRVSTFLASRGLFLVLLELTVVRLAWTFDPLYAWTPLQVIWAIGWSMVALSLLVFLPVRAVLGFGVATIALHDLLDGRWFGPRFLWSVLHAPASFTPVHGHRVFVIYPLVPWVGVIAVGYALGPLLLRAERRRILVVIGTALTLSFVLVRALARYGDPHPFVAQPTLTKSVIAFLSCEKYPPSLDYLLMTLGPALLVLAAFDRPPQRRDPLVVFGKVPLFFYVAHLYLLHAASLAIVAATRGAHAGSAFGNAVRATLPWVYVAWLVALAVLYPACVAYARLKARRRDVALLRYL